MKAEAFEQSINLKPPWIIYDEYVDLEEAAAQESLLLLICHSS